MDPIKHLEGLTEKTQVLIERRSTPVLKRYPILFGTLSLFGFVLVVYGFEKVADSIPFINEQPLLILLLGVFLLLLTGTLYKQIGQSDRV